MKYILFLLFFFGSINSIEKKKLREKRSSRELTVDQAIALAAVNSEFSLRDQILEDVWMCPECGLFASTIIKKIDNHLKEHRDWKKANSTPKRMAEAAAKSDPFKFLCLNCPDLMFTTEKAYEDHLKKEHSKEVTERKEMPLWGIPK